MKKYVITVSLGIITICILLLILLGLRPRDLFVPSYSFLGGRSPVVYREPRCDKILYKQQLYIYSFEAGFNDVCSNADAELFPEGFVNTSMPLGNSRTRFYTLNRMRPLALKPIVIMIHNNRGYMEKDDTFGPRDG